MGQSLRRIIHCEYCGVTSLLRHQELEEKLESREIDYKKCERLHAQREQQHLRTIQVRDVTRQCVTNALCFMLFIKDRPNFRNVFYMYV